MRFALLLVLAASAFALDPRLSTPVPVVNNAQRVDACHVPNCTLNAEIVYDAQSTVPCSSGGFAYHVWKAHTDGTHAVDLTATAAGLSAYTLNTGSPVLSYDGAWIMLLAQTANSNNSCSGGSANPGAGFDSDIVICDFPAVAACTKMTSIIPNIGTGFLHPHWTTDQSLVYVMNSQGVGNTNAGFYGRISWWSFTTPASVPTFGARNNQCSAPMACTSAAVYNWYEPTYAIDNCNVGFTSGATWPTTFIYLYNLCANYGAIGFQQIQTAPSYNEFWAPDSTGSLALTITTEFSPGNPPGGGAFAPAPTAGEIAISAASSSGGWAPLTGYNIVGASDYLPGGVTMSSPVWYNGQAQIFWTRIHQGVYSIWTATFTPASGIVSGQTKASGVVTIK